jgi:two-component system sensor histidine kinase ChvG
MKRFSIGLRSKVIVLSSFLLILPWLGYNYIWEMEKFLQQGQEQTLIGTTRAVATALHERPQLFNAQASFLPEVDAGKDLYAYNLNQTIQINGLLNDWQESRDKSLFYGSDYIRFQSDKNTDNPISFTHMVGKYNGYLYGYFQVNDKYPVFRAPNSPRIDKNDHLIIALTSPQGELQHYIISVHKSGWFNAFLKQTPENNSGEQLREKRIQGFWKLSKSGYNIEFRLPLSMLGNKLGFSLHTVSDKNSRQIDSIISTSNIQNIQQLGTVLVPSPEIEQILKGMSHTSSRIWVVDRHQRVLAKTGDIRQAGGVWGTNQQTESTSYSLWDRLQSKLFAPLYKLILTPPPHDFIDELKDSTQLNNLFIEQALQGKSQSNWSLTKDKKAMILSAASPIMVGDKVMGMVVAQETTNGIRSLRNKALEKLFNVLLTIIIVGTLLLFLFASNIASRIRKLRDQTDSAIDAQGRILTPFSPSQSGDEIGDLSRGLADMVNRLGQYHFYLENLASRLSHELRTPVAVVRSSLENLSLLPQDPDCQKYINRAEKGIKRLNRILTSMSEATRIEQSLQSSEKEHIVFNQLLDGCVQGYQMTYSDYQFILNNSNKKLTINAEPDFIVQLLDKLVSNAMEFSETQHPIEISLSRQADTAQLCISNIGPLLPEKMNDELLNSMISIRPQSRQDKTHLGLGLFIAKMICKYHQGEISIHNRQDKRGVEVLVSLPIIKI